jgi:[acyl-carrier-protein] S-malonyltransferase
MSFAVLFPGQGSQFVGMGNDLFDARPDLLGREVDEILGWSLKEMCLEGPEEALTRTEHAQPALYALSFALWQILTDEHPLAPTAAAGHSLGEYTALAAAGVFSFHDGLRVVTARGRAMSQAANAEPSGMAALIGSDAGLAEQVAAARRGEGGRLEVANLNAPGQVVVAGAAEDIDWVVENARDLGVRRAIPLKVAGAFHSSFMASAADAVAVALTEVETGEPRFPVWSNTTAKPHQTSDIADVLCRQVVSPVRFQESLEAMAASGIETFVHVGPGDVTAGMARRTIEDADVRVVSSIDDLGVVNDLVTID